MSRIRTLKLGLFKFLKATYRSALLPLFSSEAHVADETLTIRNNVFIIKYRQ